MKALILFALFSIVAHAKSEIPSRLADGYYDMECWGYTVQKIADEADLKRERFYSKGEASYLTNGDVTVVSESSVTETNGKKMKDQSVTITSYDLLSDGSYRAWTNSEGKSEVDGNTSEYDVMSIRTLQVVSGGFEVNLKVSDGKSGEKDSYGELQTTFMSDGRIVIASYVREKVSIEKKDLGLGGARPATDIYQSSSTCIYSLKD